MLTLKHVSIQSFNEYLVYLHKDCEVYKVDDIKAMTKLEIHGGVKPIFAFLHVVDDDKIVKPNEIGLNNEAFQQMNLPEGATVSITLSPPPSSLSSIKRKIKGNILSQAEYNAIVNDISERRYSKMDISSFLVATGTFMTAPECLSLTEALVGDNVISWDNDDIVVDHHCLGGIPGNKTDIIITAIAAAYGLPIPKTASSSLTSCAGVADVFAVLANVDLDDKMLKKTVSETRGAIINYESLNISDTNKIISAVARQLGITQIEHIVSSVIAIKMAVGVTHLLIDIPVGANARIKTTTEALHVRKLIEYIGDMLSIEIDAVITDGSEPIGNGVGAVLEARDVMKVLRNKEDAPQDLKEKSLFLAGRILEFDPKLRGGQGYAAAKEILESGRALEVINKIIHAQGRAPQPVLGHLTFDVPSPVSGEVKAIDNIRINKIGLWAGAGKYPGAGLDLLKKVGDKVSQGESLYRIHSTNSTDFAFANSAVEAGNGFEIG